MPGSGAVYLWRLAQGLIFPGCFIRQSVFKRRFGFDRLSHRICSPVTWRADFETVSETARDLGRRSNFKAVIFLLGTLFAGTIRLMFFREKIDTFSLADMAPF